MRGFMSTWPFRGVALALCASVLLAGCAIAPRGSEERVGTAANELDQEDFDALDATLGASRDDDASDDGDGPNADDAASGSGDVDEPDPLPWRDSLLDPSRTAGQQESATLAWSEPEPDPLPWQPPSGAKDVNGGAHPDSDEAR